ncbi:MAG TPA: protein kinase [Thermoanaerobaculia bacterium]|nr:protein kinase [Thermoanaerobaculia bacterium]
MTLSAGSRLGPYEIVAPLGAGGMGEVYRARDPKLGREVAIKVLPDRFGTDADALARFEREARAVASLSHPNILAIHDFGREEGSAYAVMELLEGQTLRERLATEALPARKAIDYAVQIAHGLAAAHEKGVVHRDLKPENVFVTMEGRVKILDFGLAKVSSGEPGETRSPTVAATEPGTVMGTVGYMSPEQVRGKSADHRSDIFSCGAVLYEMLSGERAFQGESAAETMAAIAQKDPAEFSGTGAPIAPALDRIVRHCLEKNPNERFQSARDVAFDLQSLTTSVGSTALAVLPPAVSRRRVLSAVLVALAVIVAAGIGRWTARTSSPETKIAPGHFAALTDQPGIERAPAVAPDGRSFVYVGGASGNEDVFVQRVGGRIPTNLTADFPGRDETPAFSPDGEQIAFRSEREGGGIFLMGATGESVRRVTDFGFDPSWSPNGGEVAVATEAVRDPTSRATVSEIWAVDVSTGKRRLVSRGDGVSPRWSPNGYRIAYWGLPAGKSQRDVFTVAADGSQSASPVPVTNDGEFDWSPAWSPDGRFLYFSSDRGGTMNLWRVAIDERTGRVLGPPEPVTTPASWVSHATFSRDGNLLFATLAERSNLMKVEFDPDREAVIGSPVPILKGTRLITSLDWSPDGQWLVFDGPKGSREDLYLIRADGSGYRQLTDASFQHRVPRFSPDGSRIAFYSNRGGNAQIWTIHPDGSGLEQVSSRKSSALYPTWSPNSQRIAVTGSGNKTPNAILELGRTDEKAVVSLPLLPTGDNLNPFSWSRDGRFLAGFRDREDRSTEVLLYSFDTGRWESVDPSGRAPIFLSDSRRLLFEKDNGIVLYDTATKRSRQILPAGTLPDGWAMKFSVSKDDRRIAYVETQREGDIWMLNFGARDSAGKKP